MMRLTLGGLCTLVAVFVAHSGASAQPYEVCTEPAWPSRVGSAEVARCVPRGTVEQICDALGTLHRTHETGYAHSCRVVAHPTADLVLIESASIEGTLVLAAGPRDARVVVATLDGWSALGGNHPEHAHYVRRTLHRVGSAVVIGIETQFEHSDDYANIKQSVTRNQVTFCLVRGRRARDTRCTLQVPVGVSGSGREWAPSSEVPEEESWTRRVVTRTWRSRVRARASVGRDGRVRLHLQRGTWAALFWDTGLEPPSNERARTHALRQPVTDDGLRGLR